MYKTKCTPESQESKHIQIDSKIQKIGIISLAKVKEGEATWAIAMNFARSKGKEVTADDINMLSNEQKQVMGSILFNNGGKVTPGWVWLKDMPASLSKEQNKFCSVIPTQSIQYGIVASVEDRCGTPCNHSACWVVWKDPDQ
jgi:hypothetical protein